jgi:formamidopyrimidine-DNA glycosylase
MPELPEVEHTRQNLVRWMQGARIENVTTTDALIVKPKPSAFIKALNGRTIVKIERIGKWLRLLLDDDRRVFVHLGMTGWFEPSEPGAEPLRFERVGFDLVRKRKKSRVAYVDSRRWGRFTLSDDDIATWKKLGPDPLAAGIDEAALAQKLARRKKTTIKETLMDQTVLAGVGNIQAIEALWRAKIDPRSRAAAMTAKDISAIAKSIKVTIEHTLADLAKSADTGSPESREHNPFKIYGRKDTPCPRCKTTLVRMELGGRTTTYCPGCQIRKK